MDKLQQRALDILSELGSRPAAPFHEDGPAAYILETLTDIGLSPRTGTSSATSSPTTTVRARTIRQ